MKRVILVFAVLFVSAPVSLFLTLMLVPFWRWCEASTGIETIGHSGPADWCYLAVFALIVFAFLATWRLAKRR